MLIPYEVEHDPHNAQESAWLVYLFLFGWFLVWVYTGMMLRGPAQQDVFYRFGISRFEYRWWTFFTCSFLHGGFMHLLGNSLFFWLYGASLEKLVGSFKFLLLYLVGAFLSVNIQILTMNELQAYEPCIGASGAVSAILGCFFVMLPRARLRCLFFSPISFRPIMILAPAWLVLGLWFGGQLLFTLGVMGAMPKIAFWAHVAGFAAGAAAGTLLNLDRRRRLRRWSARAKTPMQTAWSHWIAGRPLPAQTVLDENPQVHPDARATRTFMEAALSLAQNPGRAGPLLKAFRQASDYHNDALQVSLYLRMIRSLDPGDVPPAIHRQAGFAAITQKQDDLALTAFCRSLGVELHDRDDQMLQGLETMFAERRRNPALVAAVKQLRRPQTGG